MEDRICVLLTCSGLQFVLSILSELKQFPFMAYAICLDHNE
jgi:hypothetical protein